MTIETIRGVLGWCALINIGLLLGWALLFILAHDWMYRLHRIWFKIPEETFDAIHYGGMAAFKITFLVFNLVPYLAMRMV